MTNDKTISKVIELKGLTKEELEAEARRTADVLRQEQERLLALEKEFQKYVSDFSDMQTCQPLAGKDMDLFYSYFMHLNSQIARQKVAVLRRQEELEKNKKAVLEAHKEQRVLEMYHDRILQAKVREAGAREQKEADERFLQRRRVG